MAHRPHWGYRGIGALYSAHQLDDYIPLFRHRRRYHRTLYSPGFMGKTGHMDSTFRGRNCNPDNPLFTEREKGGLKGGIRLTRDYTASLHVS